MALSRFGSYPQVLGTTWVLSPPTSASALSSSLNLSDPSCLLASENVTPRLIRFLDDTSLEWCASQPIYWVMRVPDRRACWRLAWKLSNLSCLISCWLVFSLVISGRHFFLALFRSPRSIFANHFHSFFHVFYILRHIFPQLKLPSFNICPSTSQPPPFTPGKNYLFQIEEGCRDPGSHLETYSRLWIPAIQVAHRDTESSSGSLLLNHGPPEGGEEAIGHYF